MTHLFTTLYNERRPERRAELDYAIALNAQTFDRVCVLCEDVAPISAGNVEYRTIGRRQTYADLLAWAGECVGADDLCVIANCDVVAPARSVALMLDGVGPSDAWCLSRYEVKSAGGVELLDFEWSQDVWAFRGVPEVDRAVAEFPFGQPGVDNRFAHELAQAGYLVSNPSRSVVTIHLHASNRRTPTNTKAHRVPPPYLTVMPTHLGERGRVRSPHGSEKVTA